MRGHIVFGLCVLASSKLPSVLALRFKPKDRAVTHKAVRPGAQPHVPPVMAEGDFRLMTPLYDNLQ